MESHPLTSRSVIPDSNSPHYANFQFSIRSAILLPAFLMAALVLFSTSTKGCVFHATFGSIDAGMTKARVIELVGQPYAVERADDGSETWRYTYWRGLSAFVEFSEGGLVESTWLL